VVGKIKPSETGKRGVASFFGTWPGDETDAELEAMLRQFEYEADLLAVDGKTGIDTAWLREQLGMRSDLAD